MCYEGHTRKLRNKLQDKKNKINEYKKTNKNLQLIMFHWWRIKYLVHGEGIKFLYIIKYMDTTGDATCRLWDYVRNIL